jgi:hypothetical protein
MKGVWGKPGIVYVKWAFNGKQPRMNGERTPLQQLESSLFYLDFLAFALIQTNSPE